MCLQGFWRETVVLSRALAPHSPPNEHSEPPTQKGNTNGRQGHADVTNFGVVRHHMLLAVILASGDTSTSSLLRSDVQSQASFNGTIE